VEKLLNNPKINLDNCYKIISGRLHDFCSEAKVKGFLSQISKGLNAQLVNYIVMQSKRAQ